MGENQHNTHISHRYICFQLQISWWSSKRKLTFLCYPPLARDYPGNFIRMFNYPLNGHQLEGKYLFHTPRITIQLTLQRQDKYLISLPKTKILVDLQRKRWISNPHFKDRNPLLSSKDRNPRLPSKDQINPIHTSRIR